MNWLIPCILYVMAIKFPITVISMYENSFLNYDMNNPTFKIMGGIEDSTVKWPFITALNFFNGSHNSFCTGSIIKQSWVLTAAHCIPSNMSEVYGSILRNNLYVDGGVEFIGKLVTVHYEYSYAENNISNDIALVKLDKKISSDSVVALAQNPLVKGTSCKIFGWGFNTIDTSFPEFRFYFIKVKVISISDCITRTKDENMNEEKICTVWRKKGNYHMGNTGGPLICNGEQYGVLSWSPYCNVTTNPLIWTRIEYYLEWINKVIKEHEYGNLEIDRFEDQDFSLSKIPEISIFENESAEDQAILESNIKEDIIRFNREKRILQYFGIEELINTIATTQNQPSTTKIPYKFKSVRNFSTLLTLNISLLCLCSVFWTINR